MSNKLTEQQKRLGIRRLTIGLRIFIGWGIVGVVFIAISMIGSIGKSANQGFFSAGTIALFSFGFSFVMIAAISYRAFYMKRKDLRDS
jgi:hypothetical protein